MRNGYKLLNNLTESLNKNDSLIKSILREDKEKFSLDETKINIVLGIFSEIKDITCNLDNEIFILNQKLYEVLNPIIIYSKSLFNEYNLVNTYKLYDALKLDVTNLKNLLNLIKEN